MPAVDLVSLADTFFGLALVVGYFALIVAVVRNVQSL